MKFFKNFQTKKQLREEIERLRWILYSRERAQAQISRYEIKEISASILIGEREKKVPVEFLKKDILGYMAKEIEPLIEWEYKDQGNDGLCRILKGRISVVKK